MSAKPGSLSIVCVRLGSQKLSIVRSNGVSAIQGLLTVIILIEVNIEVNGRTVRGIGRYFVSGRYIVDVRR